MPRSDGDIPIIGGALKCEPRIEIARSFSYKLNVGNYESRDFFCSQKVECGLWEADAISDRVHNWCKAQVLRAVREYQQEAAAQFSARKAG